MVGHVSPSQCTLAVEVLFPHGGAPPVRGNPTIRWFNRDENWCKRWVRLWRTYGYRIYRYSRLWCGLPWFAVVPRCRDTTVRNSLSSHRSPHARKHPKDYTCLSEHLPPRIEGWAAIPLEFVSGDSLSLSDSLYAKPSMVAVSREPMDEAVTGPSIYACEELYPTPGAKPG